MINLTQKIYISPIQYGKSAMLKTAKNEKTLPSPPKSWRNHYKTTHTLHFTTSLIIPPGKFFSSYLWPSKEIAEEKASKWLKKHNKNNYITYLGAKPEKPK
jgi:hypothetical protein